MNKIEFFKVRRGTDNKPEALLQTGMPMVVFSEDESMKLILAYWHTANEWYCTEIYTGLRLTTGKTKADLFKRIAQYAGQVFEIERTDTIDDTYNQMHQIVAAAYRQLDEARPSGLFGEFIEYITARPSGLFGRHSLSQELIEYITAPTFKEAIRGGKEE